MATTLNPLARLPVEKATGWRLFLKTVLARAYPRVVGQQREKSWVFFEIFLPMLAVSAYVFVYRAIHAPEAYVGFVVIGGAMTAGPHLVQLGEAGDLPQVADAPRVNHGGADVVDQLLLNELAAVVNRIEHLADGERCRRVLADQPEALLVLGRSRVFEPEEMVRLERSAEARCFDGR